ncbi:DUF302 domain-containing protein [Modicisalibacter radicis]|uniref:DUF302 domain-containing protein n=1 Tax=Halomonas sp. EAR18 TaxID=2518972 RepID=UPI00109D3D9D|nr:DUF302 domain-containing protein [Halomonas sp. EAR18]
MKAWLRVMMGSLAIVAVSSAGAEPGERTGDAFPGIEHVGTGESVNEVEARLREALESRGLRLFSVIDHTRNAAGTGLELPPTRTVIFGNPKVGTPMMQCQGSAALDLPQKMVIRKEGDGTRIEWNAPGYLAQRHGLRDCELPLEKIATVLEEVAREAAGQ